MCAGDSTLNNSLCHCVLELVLDGQLRGPLVSGGDSTVRIALALVSRLLQVLSSHCLVMTVVRWLCAMEDTSALLPRMLYHCRRTLSQHETHVLQLLQTALECSRGAAAELLVSEAVLQRRYFDCSAAEVQQNSWSDEEDERVRKGGSSEGQSKTLEVLSPGSQPFSRTFAPSNINR